MPYKIIDFKPTHIILEEEPDIINEIIRKEKKTNVNFKLVNDQVKRKHIFQFRMVIGDKETGTI
jgi:hypothetical protein